MRRILWTLMQHQWVQQDEVSRAYSLGFGLLPYAEKLRTTDLVNITASAATRLRDLCGETVSVQVRSGPNRVVIQEVEGIHPLRRRVAIGNTLPLYASASGRALLAFLKPAEIDEAMKGRLLLRTPKSVTDHARIKKLLLQTAQTGFAVTKEQTELGVGAIATPVFNELGYPVASIAVSGPLTRWASISNSTFIQSLLAEALAASQLLGFKGTPPWFHTTSNPTASPEPVPSQL